MSGRRVLWLTPVPLEGAGSRFRVYQFLPALGEAGITCDVRPFLDPAFFRIVYGPGRMPEKIARFLVASLRRLREMLRVGRYDALAVYRETFPMGGALIERWARRRGVPLIFDLDDAIYLRDEVTVNPLVRWLRMPGRVAKVIRWATLVTCGSDYLARWCRPSSGRLLTVPTSVDLTQFAMRPLHRPAATVMISWVGSQSSARLYLEIVREPLRRLSEAQSLRFNVIGAREAVGWPGVTVNNRVWRLDEEVGYFRDADIGVYPLRDDEWGRGKCGFKAIQFMAVGVPVVASPVGANLELIRDGVNGFFARTDDEWVEKLTLLIRDPWLRQRMGEAARKTVEERYSLQAVAPRLVDAFRAVVGA